MKNLKVYRIIKYKNKCNISGFKKCNIRSGDRVKVIRGIYKNKISVVLKVISGFVYLKGILQKSFASSKYNSRNNNKKLEVNKYFKFSINNVIHVDIDGNILHVIRKNIIRNDGRVSKNNLFDQNGNFLDNFMQNVILRREKKKSEKNINEENNNDNVLDADKKNALIDKSFHIHDVSNVEIKNSKEDIDDKK